MQDICNWIPLLNILKCYGLGAVKALWIIYQWWLKVKTLKAEHSESNMYFRAVFGFQYPVHTHLSWISDNTR